MLFKLVFCASIWMQRRMLKKTSLYVNKLCFWIGCTNFCMVTTKGNIILRRGIFSLLTKAAQCLEFLNSIVWGINKIFTGWNRITCKYHYYLCHHDLSLLRFQKQKFHMQMSKKSERNRWSYYDFTEQRYRESNR